MPPQDPRYQQAARDQADAERLVAQQQRDAQRAANAQAKQQARDQEDAANAARKADLSRQELEYRAQGMIPVTTADGNLHPDPQWEQKQAEKTAQEQAAAAKAATKAQAAQISDQFKREGRKFFTSQVTGLPTALESDSQLAEAQKARASAARKSALNDRITGLETLASDPDKRPLADKARANVVKNVKKVIQEKALPALQASLQERAKAVDGGNDYIPWNESATPDAKAAQEHLARLQSLDPSNPDLTDEDLALLEANDTTKPFVQTIRNGRAILARDQENKAWHDQHDATVFDLKLRRDDPAAWAEMQRTKRAAMDPASLRADLEASGADLQARSQELNDAFAPIQQRRAQTQQKLTDLSQQAAQRRQQGLTAGEMVTMTLPDGSTETWPADLAAEYERHTAIDQEAEAQDAPTLERIIAQRDDLLAQEALHNEGAALHAAKAQEADQQTRQQIDSRLQFTPGHEHLTPALQQIQQDAQQRQQALAAAYPDGVPPEATAALQHDVESRVQALTTDAQQRATAAEVAYNDIKKGRENSADIRADSSGITKQHTAAMAAQFGITEAEALRLIGDVESLDWSQQLGKHEGDSALQGGGNFRQDKRTHRILSNGGLVIHPRLIGQPEEYAKAVEASEASPEAKADAMARLPSLRTQFGQQALQTVQGYAPAKAEFEAWQKTQDKATAALPPEEQAALFADHLRAKSGPVSQLLDQVLRRTATGVMALGSQILGLGAGITGSETLAQGAVGIDAYTAASRSYQDLTGASDSLGNRIVGQVAEIVPSTAASLGGGLVARGGLLALARTGVGARILGSVSTGLSNAKSVAEATKAMSGLMQTAGLAGAATAGAAQTYGSQISEIYGSLRDDGLSHEEALSSAQTPALLSAAVTALLTFAGGATGVEKLLAAPAVAREVVGKRFQAIAKSILKEGAKEAPEEVLDEAFSTVAAALGKDPNASIPQVLGQFAKSLPELAAATFLLGGAGGAQSAFQENAATGSSSNLPETVAPAWTAIENHVATDATGQTDPALTDQQQRRAALALSLAQGGEVFDVEAADLAAAGWTRDGDKFKPIKDYAGPQVLDIDAGGLPVIKDSYITALRQTGLAPVANAIGMTETQTRNFYAQRNQQQQPTGQNQTGPQQPQSPTTASPAPNAGSSTNGSPVQDTAKQGPVTPPVGSTPPQSGDALTQGTADTPVRTDAPSTVADTLANHLADRGLDRAAASAAAEEITARPEFDGMSYEQIIAEGPKFRAALDDLGVAGSLNSKDVTTNPLQLKPGSRIAKVKADMEAKAAAVSQSKSSQTPAKDPFEAPDTPVTPVNKVPAGPVSQSPRIDAAIQRRIDDSIPDTPEHAAALKSAFTWTTQQLAQKAITEADATAIVARLTGAKTHTDLRQALELKLGWTNTNRANAAAALHFGDKSLAGIPLASGKRDASNRSPSQSLPVSKSPRPQVSKSGPDQSLAADPSPIRKNRAYAADKLRVLAGIKDPSKKAWARQFFIALEQSIQRHHRLYDAYAVGGPARRHLDGQMTAVLEVEGKITRLIDLDAMVGQFDYLQSPQDALRATSIEEDIHATVLQIAREKPQDYGYNALIQKWQQLPAELQQTVWQAYRAANQTTASAAESTMPKLKPVQEWHMMNEFLRMLVQDAAFAGAITESVDTASGLIGWVQDLLKNLSRLLKDLMGKVQPDLRANLDRMVKDISARLSQIEDSSAAQKDRLAVLPSLRDPAAYATTVLESLGTTENAGILSNAALARVFDQLDPALQSRALASWKLETRNQKPETNRAPKDALMRTLLSQFLGSRRDSQRLATALAGMQSPPKTTSLLTKIMDRLLDRVQDAPTLDLLSQQSDSARRDLKNLHIATLRAIGGIRSASFVHDLSTKPALVTALEAPALEGSADTPVRSDSPSAERRRADFLAALASREQDHEDARNDENQLKLRQRLFAEESANPVLEDLNTDAARSQQRLADFLAALDDRDRQIDLDHRDASSAAAGPALRHKLRQEELAYHRQLSYLRGEALAQIQQLTDLRRLPEPTKRLLFDFMQIAAGRFEGLRPADVRLSGFVSEQAFQRLGLRITDRGTLVTTDPVNTSAYVERRHVIIRQETLDTVADIAPAVAAFLHFRIGSEYDQRQKYHLPTFAKPQPQLTDEVEAALAPDPDPMPEGTDADGTADTPVRSDSPSLPISQTPAQSPFAANTPSLPVSKSPSPAPTARVPLGGRNSLPAQFATAEDLAAFQYQLDRDALLREGTPEKDRTQARDRITTLRARLIDETGATKEEVEQKLADYHRAVIEAAKKADPVEVFRPVSFSNFLRARGTQAKADTLVAPEGGDLLSALQSRVKRIGKISQAKNAGEWDWYRQLQQQVQGENAGRPLSRRQLQQAQKAAQNGDVSTPLNLLAWLNLNVVDADKGMPIDEAATTLADTGRLDENDPNAEQPFDVTGASLGDSILAAIESRVALRDQGGDPALKQEAQTIRQGSDFRAVAEGAPGRAFTGSELAARLQPGDEIQLGTEWLTVTDVDADEGTLALDSDRYGPQGLESGQTIHLLAIGDETFPSASPSPSPQVSKSPRLSAETLQALQTALPPGQRDFLATSAIESTLKPSDLPKATAKDNAALDADLRTSIDAGNTLDTSAPQIADSDLNDELGENADDYLDGEALNAALRREGFKDVPKEALALGQQAAEAWLNAPVPYFEAKPQRAVALSEFAGAVIPESAPSGVKTILDKHGILHRTYTGPSANQASAAAQFAQDLNDQGLGTLFASNRLPSTPWPDNFPDVVIHTNIATMRKHPLYTQAKAGDTRAAVNLVIDIVKPDRVRALSAQFPQAMWVAVHAEEASGRNKIPLALSRYAAELGSQSFDDNIVQTNRVNHTGADAAGRLGRTPQFTGRVEIGRDYIIVDDVTTSGSSLAGLRDYIVTHGGKVAAAMTLATTSNPQTGYGGHLALKPDTAALLRRFDKSALEAILKDHGIAENANALTNSQGRYIATFQRLDTLRDRLVAAGQARISGPNGADITPADKQADAGEVNLAANEQLSLFASSRLAESAIQGYLDLPNVAVPAAKQLTAKRAIRATAASTDPYDLPASRGDVDRSRRLDTLRERAQRTWRGLMNQDVDALKEAFTEKDSFSTLLHDFISREIPRFDIRGAIIENPADFAAFNLAVRTPYFESLKIAIMDAANQVVHSQIVHVGGLNEATVDPKVIAGIIATARMLNPKAKLTGWMIAHNHPSGDPSPSDADRRVTRRLVSMGENLGLPLIDHVVTNGERYFSFREAGMVFSSIDKSIDQRPTRSSKPKLPVLPTPNAPFQDNLADWEAIPSGAFKTSLFLNQPDKTTPYIRALRTADPDHYHVLFLDTRLALRAVERIPTSLTLPQLFQRIVLGAAREGANAFTLGFPATVNTPQGGYYSTPNGFVPVSQVNENMDHQPSTQQSNIVRRLREQSKDVGLIFADAMTHSQERHFSFSEHGLMEEPGALASAPRRAYQSMEFAPPFATSFGEILSYHWVSKPVGGMEGQRISDWSAARTNAVTGRDIVHHFKVRKPDGIHTVSLETALGQLSIPQRSKLQGLIRAEQERRQDQANGQMALFSSPRLPVSQSPSLATQVASAAARTNTNATPAQREAENYETGKVTVHGLRLSIENPAGSVRSGTDANGKPWSVTMPHHYGRILGTVGRDKDHLDFFLGPNPDSQLVLIVNQRKTGNGHFDEHKVMLGFNTPAEAAKGYLKSYSPGWKGFQSAVPTTIPVLKHWITTHDTTQPVTKEQIEKLAKTVPLPSSAHDKPTLPISPSPSLPVSESPPLPASTRLLTKAVALDARLNALPGVEPAARLLDQTTAGAGKLANLIPQAIGGTVNAITGLGQHLPGQQALAALGPQLGAADQAAAAAIGNKIADGFQRVSGKDVRKAPDAVAAWLQQPAGLGAWTKNVVVDQLLPNALLPREFLALTHEMQRKAAFGTEKSNDLLRALSGNPRLSDLAYPKEFAENMMYREQMFDAMEGRFPMASLPPEMQRLAERLRTLLRETGAELVRQGIMHPDTFAELQTNGWMPRYTLDEAMESGGSVLAAFKLGVRDLLQQRSTAYHIVDTARKGKDGQPPTVNRREGGRNAWRFRDAASRDAFYHDFVRQQTLDMLQEGGNKVVADMLAPLSRGDKMAMRDQIKSLTVDQIANTAKLSPMLAGIVKQAKKHQYDRFAPKDPFEPEKLIKDPVYAIARYVLAQTHNAATMELLRETAKHPEWVSDVALQGFTEIPDGDRFGPLAGKFVQADIAAQILDKLDIPNAALRFYDAILRKWKSGKLVWNPGSHIRDAVGNTVFAYLGGSNIFNPGNWHYYQKALQVMRNGGPLYAELIENAVLGGDAYSSLVRERLKGLLPDAKTVENFNPGLIQRLFFDFGAKFHATHEQLAEYRRMPDDFYKIAAYLKAKDSMSAPEAAAHVRKWFPYYDRLGGSATTRAAGRFINPFLSFFRESTRILATAAVERPIALGAALAFPAAITALSAMMLGLDDRDREEIAKDLSGRGKGILGLGGLHLFSMLLPMRGSQGQVQQFDISAIMPFADLLGQKIVPLEEKENAWQTFWRQTAAAGPVGNLGVAWITNRDLFSGRHLVEADMSTREMLGAYTQHAAGVALPPLLPDAAAAVGIGDGGALTRAGTRQVNKTLATYDPVQTIIRSVVGLNVKNATPDLYRLADDWRKAHGYEVTEGMDYGSTTPASRARKALFGVLSQDEPNPTAIKNILKSLAEMGHPVRTDQDINRLLFYRDPLKLIGGNKALGISPTDAQAQFRASLQGEARQALERALQEFQRIKANAPRLIRAAQ